MLWRYVERKVKNSLYPDLHYWSPILPHAIRKSIYKKHGLNIKFEFIPEWWSPYDYFLFFGKIKGYHYPTDDDIKFFYFTLFKKNGFLFILLVLIVYKTKIKKNKDKKNGKYFKDFLRSDARKVVTTVCNPKL
jgi:hypothetical protein